MLEMGFFSVIMLPIMTLFLILYILSRRNFNYWKKRNIPGPEPNSFVGNIWEVCCLKESIGTLFTKLYLNSKEPFLGLFIFDEPCLLIRSPKIMKNIFATDFNYFKDRSIATPEHDDIIANTMFLQKNPDWKTTRTKITTVFTSAKMKIMFDQLKAIGTDFVKFLKSQPGQHDAKDVCSNYALDVIMKCFFGVNANSFDQNAHVPKIGKSMFAFTLRNAVTQTIYFFKTSFVNIFGLKFFDKKSQEFFVNLFLSTVETRKRLNIQHKDFISTLMDFNKEDPNFGKLFLNALYDTFSNNS